MVDGSTSMRIFSSMVTETPMRPSSSIMVVTSCKCGTFDTVTGPSASKHPANMGNVAFLAPEMRISPSSGMPPLICSLSTSRDPALACKFFRCEHLQRQRVNLVPHRLPQGAIDQLMTLDGATALECSRNHHGLEMHVAPALAQRLAAGQAGFDDFRHLFWIHDPLLKIIQAYAIRLVRSLGSATAVSFMHESRIHRRRPRRSRPPGAHH